MWDGLAHDNKEVYKKKTEAAKKEYLKTLAVYRASIVSKGEETPSKSTAGTISPQQIQQQQLTNTQSSPQQSLPVQQQQQQQTVKQDLTTKDEPQLTNQSLTNQPNPINNQQTFHTQQSNQQQSIQTSPYQQQTYNPNAYKSPPTNQIVDYNNQMMPIQQQQHNQVSPIHPQNSAAAQNHQMQMHQQQSQQVPIRPINYGYEQQPPPIPTNQQMMTPIDPYTSAMDNHANLQQSHHQYQPQNYGSEGYLNAQNQYNAFNPNNINLNQQQTSMQPPDQLEMQTSGQIQQCIRHGCSNQAISHQDWEDEYCSSECVISHCRSVFSNWVQQNNSSVHPQQNFSVVK